jgi:proteasome lid subunit RPN8/RPN11
VLKCIRRAADTKYLRSTRWLRCEGTSVNGVIQVRREVLNAIVHEAVRAYPLEACGLISGPTIGTDSDSATEFHRCDNMAESARVYTIDPKDHLRIEREVDDNDHEVIGVVHSHTHSEPYPSPTDVGQAPDPSWHYIIVSLKRESPETRCYRIIDGEIIEESIELID